MTRVVLASGNPGKLREFADLLAGKGLELTRQSELGIEPPPETGQTFLDNALIKARNAARLSGLPAIADDSGIEVDALDGAPGVHSARYAGDDASDAMNLDKLLRSLEGVPDARRGARYRCVIVFVRDADDEHPLIGEGTWEGWITAAPRGAGGFGYDPAFIPGGETRTAAQMSASEKHAVSHRGQAMRLFLAQFDARRRAG
jgi:XTP/dITP diphosphohydrolase